MDGFNEIVLRIQIKTNAEYYEVDRSAASKKHSEANEHINKTIKKSSEVKYYAKNIAATGVDQGLRMAKKQALEVFLYEFQAALMVEMKEYLKQYNSYHTFERKIAEFNNACNRVKERVFVQAKNILMPSERVIGGFVANLITIFINTFATTTKNIARVLNDGFHALIRAFKVLIAPPEKMTKKRSFT